MRKLLTLLLVLTLVLAACGGDDDDGDVASVEDAESCEDLGDVFVNETQTLLDELADMSLADLEGSEGEPQVLTDFQASIDEISAKSEELECSDEEISEILTERVDDLEAEGPVAELILQAFQEGLESGEIFETQ